MKKFHCSIIFILLILLASIIFIKYYFLPYKNEYLETSTNYIIISNNYEKYVLTIYLNENNQTKVKFLKELALLNNLSLPLHSLNDSECIDINVSNKEILFPNYSLKIYYQYFNPFGFPPIFVPENSKLIISNGNLYLWEIKKKLKLKFTLINLIYILLVFLTLCISTLYIYYCILRINCIYLLNLLKNKKIEFYNAINKIILCEYIVLPVIVICFIFIEFLIFLFFLSLKISYGIDSILTKLLLLIILIVYIILYSSIMRYIFYKTPNELFSKNQEDYKLIKLIKTGIIYTIALFIFFLFILILTSMFSFISVISQLISITIGILIVLCICKLLIKSITYPAPEEIYKFVVDLSEKLNINFSQKEIRVLKNSKNIINAGLLAFPKIFKYIILTEGCIENLEKDELKSVLAHELGHYYKNHSVKRLILYIVIFSILIRILEVIVNLLPLNLGLIVFIVGIVLVIKSSIFITNILSIKYEYEADLIACELTSPDIFIKMLNKISEKEEICKTRSKFLDIIFGHPSVSKRIEYIKKNFKIKT